MAVIIEANYSKKLGLPEYSSHQYSVTLRTEISDLSQLERVNAELYERLQTAVDGQIVQQGFVPGKTTTAQPARFVVTPANEQAWKCSDKQRDLIIKLTEDNHLDKATVEELAQNRFRLGVRQLNKLQASALIDELIETYGGKGQGSRARQPYAGRTRQ